MHGAHEPLAFRNRLFRFLVERMGFTAIALESGFTESISARSFIEGGEGNAETAARTGLGRPAADVSRRTNGPAEQGGAHVALNATVLQRKCLLPNSDHALDCGGCFPFRTHIDARNCVLR